MLKGFCMLEATRPKGLTACLRACICRDVSGRGLEDRLKRYYDRVPAEIV
jgi:hypothetical protein